jgi:hypothetical protein
VLKKKGVIVFIIILTLLSIFSGCDGNSTTNTATPSTQWTQGEQSGLITTENGNIDKAVVIRNLTINALDYKTYNIESLGKSALQINFKVTNVGNELEHFPDKVVLVLYDGSQITPIDDIIQNTIFKGIKGKIGIDVKSSDEVFQGATRDFSAIFWISSGFDLKSTKIEVLYGNNVYILS